MLNPFDSAYHDLCNDILEIGNQRDDRTHTGTISKFGHQIRFDLTKGFPLLTTKKVSFKLIATELLWFIKGDTNIKYLLNIIIIFGMNGLLKNIFNLKIIMVQI